MNPVLKSIKTIIEKSKFVKINKENLLKFCSEFKMKEKPFWLNSAPFDFQRVEDKKELNFLFVFNSLVFCFWGEPKWRVEYKGRFYDGAWGLLVALRKAIESGFPILSWKYLADLSKNDLKEILKGSALPGEGRASLEIPLFRERLNILRENGMILVEKFNSNFKNVINQGKGDALKLLKVITESFPSFNDFAISQGQRIFFHKKAQLLISDIYRKFKNKSWGKFKNIDKLTALADYKIPQVLRKLKILEYSPELSAKVDNRVLISAGSQEEVEIRANTIWAIELMRKEIGKKIPDIKAIDIDSYLWLQGQKKSPDDKPYHLTRTIFY